MRQACPRCGRDTDVEELGVTVGSIWLHCQACHHLWRQPGPNLDAFTVILARTSLAMPVDENCPPHGTPRATRFLIRSHVRYRATSAREWNHALTENISRSGVLFRSRQSLEPSTGIELTWTLPSPATGEPETRIRSRGSIVRTSQPRGSAENMVAAAIDEYAFAQS